MVSRALTTYITVDELATSLRKSPHAIYMQRVRNEAPGNLGFKSGGRILFDPADIEEYIDSIREMR